jgi:general stress protein 26
MKKLLREIVDFFQAQNFVIVSTVDKDGSLHNACKGIVKIDTGGSAYLLDLYKGKTFNNLTRNSRISITAVDEHRFKGYCLKGRAKIIKQDVISPQILKAWELKISSRITQRLLKNVLGQKGHLRHPEALLPRPEYMIVADIKDIVDLTPRHLKSGGE